MPLSERAEGCFWQPCHAVFLKKTKIRHFRQREKLFPFEQKSSLPSRRNIGGILLLGILQSLNRSIINETEFHLLIIFYCKDLNFFTFTNFANCSTSNLIMLCISGNRATHLNPSGNRATIGQPILYIGQQGKTHLHSGFK